MIFAVSFKGTIPVGNPRIYIVDGCLAAWESRMLERSEAVSALSWGNEDHVKVYATPAKDRLPLRAMLRIWSQRSQGRSAIKLGIYGFSCILLAIGILTSQTWPSILFF